MTIIEQNASIVNGSQKWTSRVAGMLHGRQRNLAPVPLPEQIQELALLAQEVGTGGMQVLPTINQAMNGALGPLVKILAKYFMSLSSNDRAIVDAVLQAFYSQETLDKAHTAIQGSVTESAAADEQALKIQRLEIQVEHYLDLLDRIYSINPELAKI